MAIYDYPISERIQKLKEKRNRLNKEAVLNFERNRIITEYYKNHENEYPIIKRANYLYEWCATREINIEDEDIFLGDGGPRCRTVHFDIESTPQGWIRDNFGDTDERFHAAWQVPGSIWVSDEDRKWMLEAADYWKGKDMASTIQGLLPQELWQGDLGINRNPSGDFGAQPGHFAPNYERAVTVGFGGVRKIAMEKLEEIKKNTNADNVRSYLFYIAMIKVCDGMILMSKRYAEACRKKAETAEGEEKAELLKKADSCDWIIENPARTLWEGFQTIFFYQYLFSADGTHWSDSPGLIDSYLGPLAEHDIETGELTRQEAQDLCDAFVLHLGDQMTLLPKPTNDELIAMHAKGKTFFDFQGTLQNASGGMHITVGGMMPDGTPVYNLLTELMILSYCRLRVAEPSLALRINKYTPDRIWQLGVECSKLCGGIPQFNNDDVIIQTMVDKGVPIEDARRYCTVGCVEPSICGKEWPFAGTNGSFAGIDSLVRLLSFCINGNVDPMTGARGALPCKKLYEYESFEELQEELARQIKHNLYVGSQIMHFNTMALNQYWPCPSISVMTEGCIESGKDVTWGGAKYTSQGELMGTIGTTADSLYAIKKLCFDDKVITTKELYDALCANWEGYEPMRQQIMNYVLYYGNDDDEADAMVVWLTTLWASTFNALPGPHNGFMNAGALDLYWVDAGKRIWATPDGRRKGEPLSHSSDPRQEAVKNGPLSYIKSVAKMPWNILRCGGAINLRFAASTVQGEDTDKKIRETIETYFDLGGVQFHFTVADTKVMRAAQKNPEDYQDLIVRIAGYSTYFVHMPTDAQDNYIARYEIEV